MSSPHPADEETEARRGRVACPKLRRPQAERGLARTCLTAEPVYGHFDLCPDCVLGCRGSIRARQEAWGGLRVAGPQRGPDLLRLKVPLFSRRAVSCLSTRLPPSLRSHGLSEAGPRQLLQLPQRLQPVDMGRARRVRPGRLGQGQRGPGLALHPLLCGIHLPVSSTRAGLHGVGRGLSREGAAWLALGLSRLTPGGPPQPRSLTSSHPPRPGPCSKPLCRPHPELSHADTQMIVIPPVH